MSFARYRERADLRHSVEVMADLGLVYVQSKAADGTYQYRMEPDIDIICHFDGKILKKMYVIDDFNSSDEVFVLIVDYISRISQVV